MSEQSYPSYLIHYGIEGQKWGVRRFQNEDGSYTAEGKRRYGIGSDVDHRDRMSTIGKKIYKTDKKIARNLDTAKNAYEMSSKAYKELRAKGEVNWAKRHILGLSREAEVVNNYQVGLDRQRKAEKISAKAAEKFGYKANKYDANISPYAKKAANNVVSRNSKEKVAIVSKSVVSSIAKTTVLQMAGVPLIMIDIPNKGYLNYKAKTKK